MSQDTATEARAAWREVLTPEEIRDLHRVSDLRSWFSIALDWAMIFAAFALVVVWPNVATVVLALFVIGARQLGFAVIMHEASHRSLLRDAATGDRIANWLAAYPVWLDVQPYRTYHLQHHKSTWTDEDPDVGLATPFPISRASLRRKIWRDLSGQTGWKRFKATLRRDLGTSNGKVSRSSGGWKNLRGVIVTNAVLLAILAAAGHAELYLLWVAAWFTTYSLVMRIRSIAEHSMPGDPADPMTNTRTTRAGILARIFLAPNRVNYHLEHHLLIAVPHYNLPRMHRLLDARGALQGANVANGYLEVLRRATSGDKGTGRRAGDGALTFSTTAP